MAVGLHQLKKGLVLFVPEALTPELLYLLEGLLEHVGTPVHSNVGIYQWLLVVLERVACSHAAFQNVSLSVGQDDLAVPL